MFVVTLSFGDFCTDVLELVTVHGTRTPSVIAATWEIHRWSYENDVLRSRVVNIVHDVLTC